MTPGEALGAPQERPVDSEGGQTVPTPLEAAARRWGAALDVVRSGTGGPAADEELKAAALGLGHEQRKETRKRAEGTEEEWRPPHAPHVVGRYGPRLVDEETGMPEAQTVRCVCEYPGCGATWQTQCASGRVREHVQRFGTVHLHRDPFGKVPTR